MGGERNNLTHDRRDKFIQNLQTHAIPSRRRKIDVKIHLTDVGVTVTPERRDTEQGLVL